MTRTDPTGSGVAVFVADEQSDGEVDAERWTRLASSVLADEGVRDDAEVSLLFVTESVIAELNGRFLGEQRPTDVLAFPIDGIHARRAPARNDPLPPDDEAPLLLGDVIICPAVAAANAPTHAGGYDDELALLIVHGLLHLLGHDHADPAERLAMQARERALLDAHFGSLARDPWTEADHS